MDLLLPNPVPTSGDLRIARARVVETLSDGFSGVRTPVLAGVGAADLVLDTLSTLPARLVHALPARLYELAVSRPAAPRVAA
jgi:hypothetical protein